MLTPAETLILAKFRFNLQAQIDKLNVSAKELERITGVSRYTMNSFLKEASNPNSRTPNIKTIARLADGFGIEPVELIQ